uniref:Putative tail protein n=1 Tax=viral metagenome TaxID=1070528 RepID=A0A6M3L0X6_9ZZZZ
MKLRLQMEGIPEVQRELGKIVDHNKISRALQQAAMMVTGDAMRYCPVLTGRLQKSITPYKISDLTWEIRATANYADYIEFGTYKINIGTPDNPLIYMSGSGKYPSYRPFLRSALWDDQQKIIDMFDEALDEKQ